MDDAPPPRKARPAAEDDDRPRRRPRRDEEEDDDRPRGRRPRDDEDDDRPRRRRDEDDDDDDRPRGRRSRDDDDRQGRRRRRDDDDYDEYDDRPRRSNGYGAAAVGALLLSISLWIYLGVFGVLTLFVIIAWGGGDLPNALGVLTGIAGLGNWLVAGVGLGFCLAGPKKSRGIAIAATVVAGVHLLLVLVCFGRLMDTPSASATRGHRDGITVIDMNGGSSSAAWLMFTSTIPILDLTLPLLVYASKFFDQVVIPVLAGACEVARLILILITLKSLAGAARDHDAAGKAKTGIIAVSAVCGGAAVVTLLFAVIVIEGKLTKVYNLGLATLCLIFLAHTAMLIMPALAAQETRSALARRSR